jgi:hypothetical protein
MAQWRHSVRALHWDRYTGGKQRSELEDLLFLVPKLLERTVQCSLLHAVLLARNSCDLRRRAADEDLHVLVRAGEVLFDDFAVDEALRRRPRLGCLLEDVYDLKQV